MALAKMTAIKELDTELPEKKFAQAIYLHTPIIELGIKNTAVSAKNATIERVTDGFEITSIATKKVVFVPNQNIRGALLVEGLAKKPR